MSMEPHDLISPRREGEGKLSTLVLAPDCRVIGSKGPDHVQPLGPEPEW